MKFLWNNLIQKGYIRVRFSGFFQTYFILIHTPGLFLSHRVSGGPSFSFPRRDPASGVEVEPPSGRVGEALLTGLCRQRICLHSRAQNPCTLAHFVDVVMILCYASSHRGGRRRRDALVIGRSAAEQGELVEIDVNRCRLFVKQKKKEKSYRAAAWRQSGVPCGVNPEMV